VLVRLEATLEVCGAKSQTGASGLLRPFYLNNTNFWYSFLFPSCFGRRLDATAVPVALEGPFLSTRCALLLPQ
jgi:hypothetical protein